MNLKLRQISGCGIYIIPKDIRVYLNIFRTILVTYLQQRYFGIHIRNSLFSTKSSAHYKDKVFPDSEFLDATIKDAYRCITCITIKPNNMIHIKCDFVL